MKLAPDGALWAVTDAGLARFAGEMWQPGADAPALITAMVFASDGPVW
jgi:hypothetical protein